MKTKLVIFFALLLCFGGLAFSFGHNMQEAAENPQYEIVSFYGDPSKADGLNISMNFRTPTNRGFCWDSDFSFQKDDISCNTVHYIDALENYQGPDRYHYPVSAYMNFFGGSEGLEFQNKIENELSHMNAGTDGFVRKNVRVADYFKYYPLSFSFCKPDSGLVIWSSDNYRDEDNPLKDKIEQFFRIPVSEDEMIEVSCDKNHPGSMGISSGVYYDEEYDTHLSNYDPISRSCQINDCIYFSLSSYGPLGGNVDFSLIPGGFGIYMIRFAEDGTLIPESLSTICSLDTSVFINEIRSSSDGKHLNIIAADENRQLHFLSVSAETGEILCDLCIGDFGTYYIKEKDGYLLLTLNRSDEISIFVIDQSEDGKLELLQQAEFSHEELKSYNISENPEIIIFDDRYLYNEDSFDAAYDGEKIYLLLAGRYGGFGKSAGFNLLVFDSEKLLYIGHCEADPDFTGNLNKCELEIQK